MQVMAMRLAVFGCVILLCANWTPTSQGETRPADSRSDADRASAGDFPDAARVAMLIEQLASDRFIERRQAEQDLLDRGMQVFDQIDAATRHPDPEVAASCKFVLSQLTISWARRDDSPRMKSYLSRYGALAESERMRYVDRIAQSDPQESAPALVRIIRYDTSPQVSAYAAMQLLDPYFPALYLDERQSIDFEWDAELARLLRNEAGTSVRPAMDWVHALAVQIETPGKATAAWQPVVDRFGKLIDNANYDEFQQQQYTALLWNLFRVNVQIEDWNAATGMIDELVSVRPAERERSLSVLIGVAVDRQAWSLLDHALAEHRTLMDASKDVLYRAAHARFIQEEKQAASDLADAAFAVRVGETGSSVLSDAMYVAARLQRQSHTDWARREYRDAIDNSPAGSATNAFAHWWLADSLYDWEQYEDAASVLGELADVLRNNSQASANYRRLQNRHVLGGSRGGLPTFDEIFGREDFFLACHYKSTGELDKQWQHLKQSMEHEPANADTLIAMYRASEPESSQRQMVLRKIDMLAQDFMRQIDESPQEPLGYNQWAWLISNTEGDYQKAIRYSHRSLELLPDTAGYLDTLGRCYFAAGDIENAIKYQKQAVELDSSMKVLQRQLDEFEAALVEKQQAAADATGA